MEWILVLVNKVNVNVKIAVGFVEEPEIITKSNMNSKKKESEDALFYEDCKSLGV